MRLGELLEKTDIVDVAADLGIEVLGVCFDSRKQLSGEVFIAVRGLESDGHDYIKEAVTNGAACVICEEAPSIETPYVLVRDTRKALATVSSAWFGYPSAKLCVIGVTGTNGKTTVTSLIKHVIEEVSGEKVGLIGTTGNMIGDKAFEALLTTPDSYELHELFARMLSEGCRYVVMEVSSHALSLERVHGIEFEIGVFTNLSPDHLDFHSSMDDYALAKALLFKNSRHSVVNIDDEYAQIMVDNAKAAVYTYSAKDDAADIVAKDIKLHADKVGFCVLVVSSLVRVELGIPGMFSVYNALAAISSVRILGYEISCIADALSQSVGVKGRAEVVPTGLGFTVIIDYAHTPDALANIISAARLFTQGRVVTLFGCGGDRDKKKRPLKGAIASENSDFVIVTSDNPRTEKPGDIINDILAGMKGTKTPSRVIENRREAIFWALENASHGDVLILAGKGHESYQIFGNEKVHFDEREVVAEFLMKE